MVRHLFDNCNRRERDRPCPKLIGQCDLCVNNFFVGIENGPKPDTLTNWDNIRAAIPTTQ